MTTEVLSPIQEDAATSIEDNGGPTPDQLKILVRQSRLVRLGVPRRAMMEVVILEEENGYAYRPYQCPKNTPWQFANFDEFERDNSVWFDAGPTLQSYQRILQMISSRYERLYQSYSIFRRAMGPNSLKRVRKMLTKATLKKNEDEINID